MVYKGLHARVIGLICGGLVFVAIIFRLFSFNPFEKSFQTAVMPVLNDTIDLEQIKKRGKLVALTDNSSTSYFIYKGEPMGYEYELLSRFAKSIGVELEIVVAKDMNRLFELMNSGVADVVAANITVTNERMQSVRFSKPLMYVRQMLIQRKPDGWKYMQYQTLEKSLIRDVVDLGGKVIHVRRESTFYDRLKSLSDEIGSEIKIVEAGGDKETEELIKAVAKGEIDYTIADENVALINQTYYDNIDTRTAVSFPQKIGWAMRKTSPKLTEAVDQWLKNERKSGLYSMIYTKYFINHKAAEQRIESEYFSLTGNKISEYDDLIKKYSQRLGWDWRLLASLIYQESHFDPNAQSWAGASGLMQLIPATAIRYGLDSICASPGESINAGTSYLATINNYWKKIIENEEERLKFVLASYNVGLGHVIDARNLTKKYGVNPDKWDDCVEYFLMQKSNPKYYTDADVKCGYCRGEEPCKYVKEILIRFDHYRNLLNASARWKNIMKATKI